MSPCGFFSFFSLWVLLRLGFFFSWERPRCFSFEPLRSRRRRERDFFSRPFFLVFLVLFLLFLVGRRLFMRLLGNTCRRVLEWRFNRRLSRHQHRCRCWGLRSVFNWNAFLGRRAPGTAPRHDLVEDETENWGWEMSEVITTYINDFNWNIIRHTQETTPGWLHHAGGATSPRR